jgi:molybdate transport system permease protein
MDWHPLKLSLYVAVWATTSSLVLGVGLAALLSGPKFRGRELLDALLTAPLVLPPSVLGYYVLTAFGRRSAIGQLWEELTGSTIVFTATGAVVASTIGALPLVIKSARAALEGVDVTLIRAARTLGASPGRAFVTVKLPLAASGITAALILAFAKSLGEFGVTLMVVGGIPGETETAAIYIYNSIQANRDSQAAGMIAVLSAVAIGTLYAVNRLTRRSGRAF